MASVDEKATVEATESRPRRDGDELLRDWTALQALVREIALRGDLAALIACACEEGIKYHPPAHADPGQPPHPGVHAAIKAFQRCMDFSDQDEPVSQWEEQDREEITGESVPLSAVGRWIAWSSDGLRILAIEDTLEEAQRKAVEAGEPEPILQVPPAPHRL